MHGQRTGDKLACSSFDSKNNLDKAKRGLFPGQPPYVGAQKQKPVRSTGFVD